MSRQLLRLRAVCGSATHRATRGWHQCVAVLLIAQHVSGIGAWQCYSSRNTWLASVCDSDTHHATRGWHRCVTALAITQHVAGIRSVYSRTHRLRLWGSGGSSAARMASSNTFLSPFCVSAEHSTYFTAFSSRDNLSPWQRVLSYKLMVSKVMYKI